MLTATDALNRLREGNVRFIDDLLSDPTTTDRARRRELAAGQEPFAIILGCSDSRVPAEIVFDQGLGDLFVIRIAGNIVAPSQIGSIEFAAERYASRRVVVLGHSRCGAVIATLEGIQHSSAHPWRHVGLIVERIRPAVEPLLAAELRADPERLLAHAVRANVRAAAYQLRRGSEFLESLIARGDLLVVGAEYSLETGVVDFFDGVPAAAGLKSGS